MTWPFAVIALLTVAAAIAAMSFRNLVHCALSLVVTFAGLAALFLQLNAEFVGFAQVLVYVGAVAILIVFAILLTRGADNEPPAPVAAAAGWGIAIAVATFLVLAGAVTSSVIAQRAAPPKPAATVRAIGDKLMADYILLTRGADNEPPAPVAAAAGWGIAIAVATFLVIAGAVTSSVIAQRVAPPKPAATVRAIGDKLMADYILPLEVIGLLLTAAMIGAVIIAMQERKSKP